MQITNDLFELEQDIEEMRCIIDRGFHLGAADTITQQINYSILEALEKHKESLFKKQI